VSKLGEGLVHLENKLLEMSSLVESGIQRSIIAVTKRDPGAAEDVFRNEARINTIELEIDGLAIELLTTSCKGG
jgi:phosphate uptake regulator